MAALARGFSDRHFERGEGPGDEVACQLANFVINKTNWHLTTFPAKLIITPSQTSISDLDLLSGKKWLFLVSEFVLVSQTSVNCHDTLAVNKLLISFTEFELSVEQCLSTLV